MSGIIDIMEVLRQTEEKIVVMEKDLRIAKEQRDHLRAARSTLSREGLWATQLLSSHPAGVVAVHLLAGGALISGSEAGLPEPYKN